MSERRTRLFLACLLGVADATAASAQPDERIERRSTVGGWVVEDVDEMDGGLMVRMIRAGAGYRLRWSTSFWRGNSGPARGAAFRRGLCRSGDASAIRNPAAPLTARGLRASFMEYFAECETPAAEAEAILDGFDEAFAVASKWAGEAEAAVAAEALAIANYGAPGTKRR